MPAKEFSQPSSPVTSASHFFVLPWKEADKIRSRSVSDSFAAIRMTAVLLPVFWLSDGKSYNHPEALS